MARHKPKLATQILEEASSWFIDFNEGELGAAGREEFNAWLRTSPEHVRAYLQVSAFWEDAESFKKQSNANIEGLMAGALAEQNVVPLDLPVRAKSEALSAVNAGGSRRSWLLGLAASLLLAGGAGLFAWYSLYRDQVYIAEIGEQRSITLEDGSAVQLNSRSRLRVRFTANERNIELLDGQALFRVTKNPARPFIVHSGHTSVRAVGTEFDVYKKTSGTVVTVVDGRVAVMTAAKPRLPAETYVSAGEQLTVTSLIAAPPKPANIAAVTAWTEKKLIFESTPLREVVEEFNRYNRRQFVIRDPNLYEFHVSGVFPSTDAERMVEFLRRRFGITLSRSGDEIEISLQDAARAADKTNIF